MLSIRKDVNYPYDQRKHEAGGAELLVDSTRGPGTEILCEPSMTSGQYKIYYALFSKRENAAHIKAFLIDKKGRHELPDIELSGDGETIIVPVSGDALSIAQPD